MEKSPLEIVSEFQDAVRDRHLTQVEAYKLASRAIDDLDDLSLPESEALEYRRRIMMSLQISITTQE